MENLVPVIRSRKARTLRRRDGLIRFAADRTSQNGEDGILERIFGFVMPRNSASVRHLIDVGAWDGLHLSNTRSFLVKNHEKQKKESWKGILIEANPDRFQQLQTLYEGTDNICWNVAVTIDNSPNSLPNLLLAKHSDFPKDFDLLCIDIDGNDYWVLQGMLEAGYRPLVVCIEFNPTMPNHLIYIPPKNDEIRHGASLAAIVELAETYQYVLVETTLFNAFLVPQTIFDKYFKMTNEVPDTSIEALHEVTMGTDLYQLYDGTIKISGCRKLLWHRIPIDENKLQLIPRENRTFPFAPRQSNTDAPFDDSDVVDISPYRSSADSALTEKRKNCAGQLFQQLCDTGFCRIRGTGVPRETCEQALSATQAFLQDADENVRRSCLAKDRARRGYSPMNAENFASLIGEHAPNDLVRKFRIGPIQEDATQNSLLQPNVWPSVDVWDAEAACSFRAVVEEFYTASCDAAKALVLAICEGILLKYPELEDSFRSLMNKKLLNQKTTSILTLLGYRPGTRHKGKNKGPLVAAHTDVGVITMLLFTGRESCASVQRKNKNDGWDDVTLPYEIPQDPIFIVHVADCLSALSDGKVPSTVHRVIARHDSEVPRNCCALFVGLDPNASLTIQGEKISYEEWRKRRIANAQTSLKTLQKQ